MQLVLLLFLPVVIGNASNIHITTTGNHTQMAISWSELLPEPSKYNRVSFGNAADGETSTVTYGYASATLNMSESTPATIMVTETEDIR